MTVQNLMTQVDGYTKPSRENASQAQLLEYIYRYLATDFPCTSFSYLCTLYVT